MMGGMLSQYRPHAVSNTGVDDFAKDLKVFMEKVSTSSASTTQTDAGGQRPVFYAAANADEAVIVQERESIPTSTDRVGVSQPRTYVPIVESKQTNTIDAMQWLRDNYLTIIAVQLIIIAVLILRR